jgi:uncharacterized protein YoxC
VSTYETVVVVGMGLWIALAAAILVSLFYVIGLLRRAREPLGQVSRAVDGLTSRLEPVLLNVERASASASRVAERLQSDADQVGRALRHAGESTERMVELVEDRVTEVAALLEVVQEEAEETFLTTASLLRGLRGRSSKKNRKSSTGRRVTRAISALGRR